MVEIADDGKELYWLDSQGRDRAAVVAQDLATGKFRVLAEDAQADFGEPVLDPVSCVPIAAPTIYGKRRWQVIDQAAAADLERIVGSGEGELGGFGAVRRPFELGRLCRTGRRAGALLPLRPRQRPGPSAVLEPAGARKRAAGADAAGRRARRAMV